MNGNRGLLSCQTGQIDRAAIVDSSLSEYYSGTPSGVKMRTAEMLQFDGAEYRLSKIRMLELIEHLIVLLLLLLPLLLNSIIINTLSSVAPRMNESCLRHRPPYF